MNHRALVYNAILFVGAVQFAARADVITDWNALLLNAIRTEDNSPVLATRNLAILHTAIYDAVNAVDRTHQPYFADLVAPAGTSAEVAAVAAAHEVLVSLYPSERSIFEDAYSSYLAGVPPGSARDNALALGQTVADQILTWRASDGASTTVPYIPSSAPGQWRRTPPFLRPPDSPQWPFVTPFAMTEGKQFRPPGPPALTSPEYAEGLNLVKAIGPANSAVRTDEQTLIARFWSDFSYTVTPAGHWNVIAATAAHNRSATLVENARLFALLNITLADAAIVAWDAKYTYNSWRPVTAIREADTDGNPATSSDPNWTSLLNSPPFPEYTSGHSTFSRAAALVLANFFGTDEINFTIGCDALPGVLRSFSGFSQAADESGISRIYGGIHFPSANRDGQASGAALAQYVVDNFLLPNASLPKLKSIRVVAGQGRVQLQGIINQRYLLEATTDFRQWLPVSTNVAVRGGVLISDPAAAGLSVRFYRAASR